MKKAGFALALIVFLTFASPPAQAHPEKFSYLDVQIRQAGLDLTLTVHIFDMAHDLNVEPKTLRDYRTARPHEASMTRLINERLKVIADGSAIPNAWALSEILSDNEALQFSSRASMSHAPGTIGVETVLFPYDPDHQTFVNFYEEDAITQQNILSKSRTTLDYIAGTRYGAIATVRKFIPEGFHHILIGPDHILFLVGLLLLGGPIRRLITIVTAFTVAHSVTLSLAALHLLSPPAWIIEPAIALSIVYVGVDNLVGSEGRDVRAWIALGFGFIHGFGFANVLAEMGLPQRAMGWALFAFNLGVELGQLLVVLIVASAFAALRARSEKISRRLLVGGSIAVAAAGAFWFVQRVFCPAGRS
jgi:hydrogenase/urease accessory protein HupE